ncbi:hypothetical protein OAR78_00730, partial [bacterium]|nr:hypothetical protein [bacterium]
ALTEGEDGFSEEYETGEIETYDVVEENDVVEEYDTGETEIYTVTATVPGSATATATATATASRIKQ